KVDGLEKTIQLKYPIVDRAQKIVAHLPLTSPQVISFDIETIVSEHVMEIFNDDSSIFFEIPLDIP
ncbi:MAG: hypothetical protein P8M34_10300, partial [Saprospiraceae bacterium]|nr:hypothetical protein [Saprospiraceae bacterium]